MLRESMNGVALEGADVMSGELSSVLCGSILREAYVSRWDRIPKVGGCLGVH